MSLKSAIKTSENVVNWQWPVHVGFIDGIWAKKTIDEFYNFQWLKMLSHGYFLNRIRATCNILCLHGSLDQILQITSNLSFEANVDLVAVFTNEMTECQDYNKISKTIEQLPKVNSNSLYITHELESRSILLWLNQIIYELSHNKSVDEAINQANLDGYLLITNTLKRESRVEIVLDHLIEDIGKYKSIPNYKLENVFNQEIRNRITFHSRGGEAPDIPNDILETLKRSKLGFLYDHESGDSSIVRDLSIAHNSNISDFLKIWGLAQELQVEENTTQSRFLQCVFTDSQGKSTHHALLLNEDYILKVKIGVPEANWLQGGAITYDDIQVNASRSERVDILLRYQNKLTQAYVLLPSKGPSTEATFDIRNKTKGETIFEIFAFHKTRLFQHLGISAFFCETDADIKTAPGIKIHMINMPRSVLDDFDIKEEYGLSVVFTDNKPIIADSVKINELGYESDLKQFNSTIKKTIEAYITSETPDHDDLILNLAKYGSLLYRNIFSKVGDLKKPIQIIADHTNHIPLEFLYVDEINRATTKLCPKSSDALLKGECKGCNTEVVKYLCPFGFLSLNTIIERHQVEEKINLLKNKDTGINNDLSLHKHAIPILEKTLIGTSEKLDFVIGGLRAQVADSIKSISTQTIEVNTWEDWKNAIKQSPDSLVIIGHVERSPGGINDELEIGNDLQEKVFINQSYVLSEDSGIQPFMVLIGCSTQDLEMSFMDFTQHFKNCGAAIVLSTFTKIRGAHAGPIVDKLFQVLNNYRGQEVRFGQIMLKLRQILFSEKLYASMTMVSHGDADWKIKI